MHNLPSSSDLHRALVALLLERAVPQAPRTVLCQTMFCAGEQCYAVYAQGEAQRQLGEFFHRAIGRNLNRDKGEWLLDAGEVRRVLVLAGIVPGERRDLRSPLFVWRTAPSGARH